MDKTSSFSIQKGKPIRCKAALCRKAGEALVMEEIQVDPPQAYEVRIKIICTSLCHTDVTFWKLDSVSVLLYHKVNAKSIVQKIVSTNLFEFSRGRLQGFLEFSDTNLSGE